MRTQTDLDRANARFLRLHYPIFIGVGEENSEFRIQEIVSSVCVSVADRESRSGQVRTEISFGPSSLLLLDFLGQFPPSRLGLAAADWIFVDVAIRLRRLILGAYIRLAEHPIWFCFGVHRVSEVSRSQVHSQGPG